MRDLNQNQTVGRAAFSPSEFAALFGRHPSWGYRQLYSGRVAAITSLGRVLIPKSEVERVLALAERYNPKRKPKTQHEETGQAS
jgi:hypothetical protein